VKIGGHVEERLAEDLIAGARAVEAALDAPPPLTPTERMARRSIMDHQC
jgi:hypothetical protein